MRGTQLVGRWVESYTGMSADNIKGLLLALSSSLFIGASFIVKKKGLKKAGAAGVRAGERLCPAPLALWLCLGPGRLPPTGQCSMLPACWVCRLDLLAARGLDLGCSVGGFRCVMERN
jgi:hypothetical protein